MKHVLTLVGLAVLVLGLVSCQVLGQSEPPTETTPGAGGTASPAAPNLTATALAIASATPAESPTPSTPTATPTITPTPTVTPTPIPPGAAVKPAVDGLSLKLSAFRTALSSKDVDRLSKAQLALLDEADKAEQSLKDDKSSQAKLVREAIDDIRSGASGQTQLLDSAAQALRQAGGSGASATGTPSALLGRSQGSDLATLTGNLRDQLNGYQQARRERNPENLLRRQKDLVDALTQVEQATENDNTPDGRQLHDAAASLRKALGGSAEQLTGALAQVQAAVGTSGQGQDNQASDLTAEAASLQSKAAAFRSALAGGNRGDLARLQKDLLDEVSRADSSLRGNSSPDADKLRAALSGLRDGGSGDTAKLDGAISQLGAISGTGGAAGSATGTAVGTVDTQKTAEALQGKVDALKKAIQSGSTDDQLRLQRDLYDQIAQVEPGLQGNSSKQAEALRSAVESIKNGLSGDLGKLDEAGRQLAIASGKSATQSSTSTTPKANADVGPVAGALTNRLKALDSAIQSNDPDAVAKARQDLQTEVSRASDSLRGLPPAKADRLRTAITAAGEAASGDPAKVKSALDLLQQANQ